MRKMKAVFIVGPTASGKTSLSIEIAKKFGGEIISADSMQIYKGIHIFPSLLYTAQWHLH